MDDQADVLAFLEDGASYGEPGLAVERIDTHASAVFLAGENAYKLKRAIRYSYLDYSTTARREAACRKELALNRRTAPMLYRAVRPIVRGADDTLRFAEDGSAEAETAIDWVVAMRRFDTSGLFDQLAEERRLTPELMRRLADAIVAFHAAAEPSQSHGGSEGLRRVIDGNAGNLRRAAPLLDRRQVAALSTATDSALAKVAALLDRRRQAGKVRRCHGDLHLGNICLVDGAPVLFDAIEFSDDIAVIDVLYDLAFLLMDLVHRGFLPLAALVLNRYLDLAGETEEALAALPLFLSQRAAIRAHVIATAARQQQDAAEKKRRGETAQRYLALAQALLQPGQPRLVAIGGRSGSGKTTLAQGLAATLTPAPGARVLRSDVLRKRLLGVAPETRLGAEGYTRAVTERVYAALFDKAATALAAGFPVILDAAFLAPGERDAAAQVAQAADVPFTGFWLEAPAAVLTARVDARQGDASDADGAVVAKQLDYETGEITWHRIDAGTGADSVLAAARQTLEQQARP